MNGGVNEFTPLEGFIILYSSIEEKNVERKSLTPASATPIKHHADMMMMMMMMMMVMMMMMMICLLYTSPSPRD